MARVCARRRWRLGTGRRRDSSSSTTRELLLGVAGGLPAPSPGLVERLLAEPDGRPQATTHQDPVVRDSREQYLVFEWFDRYVESLVFNRS